MFWKGQGQCISLWPWHSGDLPDFDLLLEPRSFLGLGQTEVLLEYSSYLLWLQIWQQIWLVCTSCLLSAMEWILVKTWNQSMILEDYLIIKHRIMHWGFYFNRKVNKISIKFNWSFSSLFGRNSDTQKIILPCIYDCEKVWHRNNELKGPPVSYKVS